MRKLRCSAVQSHLITFMLQLGAGLTRCKIKAGIELGTLAFILETIGKSRSSTGYSLGQFRGRRSLRPRLKALLPACSLAILFGLSTDSSGGSSRTGEGRTEAEGILFLSCSRGAFSLPPFQRRNSSHVYLAALGPISTF